MTDARPSSALGNRLHSLCISRGLPSQQMAEKCGVPKSFPERCRKMAGARRPGIDAVIAIAGGMDVSIDGLVGGAVDSPSPRLSQKDDAMVCFGLLFGGLGSQERVAGTGCESGRRRRGGRFQARRGLPGSGMPKWRQSRCRSSVRACASLRLPLMPSETIERPFLSAYMACSNKRNRKPNRSRSAQIAPTAQLISLHQFLTPAFAHSANPAKSPRSCQTF